jgi:hypothetical protein
MRLFLDRVMRAAMLDRSLYEEVEADRTATGQALAVVVISSLAAGIGSGGWHGILLALVTWAAWALLTYQIGTRILDEPQTRADVGELLRTIGFAASPGWLQAFGALPAVGRWVFATTVLWMLAAMIVAVRQALDYTRVSRAFAVCGLGLALSLAMAVVLGIVLGPVAE